MPSQLEPKITINGVQLNDGEAMTLRVALESLAGDISRGFGDDEHAKLMADGYKACIYSIRCFMARNRPWERVR